MGYFDSQEHVDRYLEMSQGYDGRELVQRLRQELPDGRSVLELGMGPGKDLLMLADSYDVVGSDASVLFVRRFQKLHPHIETLTLDAVTLDINRRFDGIYSNKIFQHLTHRDTARSLKRQHELLKDGGIALHSFWRGTEIEEYDGVTFYKITEDQVAHMVDGLFRIMEMRTYREMEGLDSFYTVLRKE